MPDAMRVYEALSRADASVGWTVMIGSGSWIDLAGLPRATFDTLYADGPDVDHRRRVRPVGYRRARRRRLPGERAVGVRQRLRALHLAVRQLRRGRSTAEHRLRMVVFAPAEVEIEDTWTVSGLCGTGSHHFTADEVLVPAERTFATLEAGRASTIPWCGSRRRR